MALTRKLLKGMGLTDEQVDTIIEAHTDTVDGLKADIGKYKADAEKLPGIQKELDDLLNGDYKGLIGKTTTKGTETQTPPSTTGGATSRAEIYKKDDKGRYVLSTAERQAAIAASLEKTN